MKNERSSLVFEILSGRTRFPFRNVSSDRFLIGAGAGCDLRLSGDDMPPLHSIVRINGDETLLEAVARTPPLRVNGQPVESASLSDGDRIAIGTFEIVAHLGRAVHSVDDVSAAGWDRPIGDGVQKRDVQKAGFSETTGYLHEELTELTENPASLSAAELASRIEQEEANIERFEQRRHLAAEALLDAVGERIELTAGRQPAGFRTTARQQKPRFFPRRLEELTAGLEQILRQAESLAGDLERSRRRLADREAESVRTTAVVFDALEKLAARLEEVLGRLTTLDEGRSRSYRKVA